LLVAAAVLDRGHRVAVVVLVVIVLMFLVSRLGVAVLLSPYSP